MTIFNQILSGCNNIESLISAVRLANLIWLYWEGGDYYKVEIAKNQRQVDSIHSQGKGKEELKMMQKVVDKTVKLDLVGLDGNAFFLIGRFRQEARRQGWKPEEIKKVTDEATKGDYPHLLATLDIHCR